MPVIDQTPSSSKDRPSLKDDLPCSKRLSPEPRRPADSKLAQAPDKPVNDKALSEVEKPKSQSPPYQKVQKAKSEYDNLEDDSHLTLIDNEIFSQILELDDDDERNFSRGMVREFFDQAEKTFAEMDVEFEKKDLHELSLLGHFLKGSSASLGLNRVQKTCEMIQHCGAKRDELLESDLSEEVAVEVMGNLLKKLRSQYGVARNWLLDYFNDEFNDEHTL